MKSSCAISWRMRSPGDDMADRISLRFGVFADARQEPDIEERFIRATIAADRVKDDPQRFCGFYEY